VEENARKASMRKRDIKVGMTVFHHRSGRNLGKVTKIGETLIYLDGESPIATPAELSKTQNEQLTEDQHRIAQYTTYISKERLLEFYNIVVVDAIKKEFLLGSVVTIDGVNYTLGSADNEQRQEP
jgi:hypothetical protein